MRVEFDPEVGAWYVSLSEAAVDRTVHLSDEVIVDVDAKGAAVGVEFLLAPTEIEAPVRAALFERFPEVRSALVDLQALAIA